MKGLLLAVLVFAVGCLAYSFSSTCSTCQQVKGTYITSDQGIGKNE